MENNFKHIRFQFSNGRKKEGRAICTFIVFTFRSLVQGEARRPAISWGCFTYQNKFALIMKNNTIKQQSDIPKYNPSFFWEPQKVKSCQN